MRYFVQWQRERTREIIYRNYIADALRLITENTAKFVSGQYLTNRYADLIAEKKVKKEPKPERSGPQIAADIIARMHE